ncbi:hypothetical protein CY34DRAFT_642890 [Suillus luteus UH-Slu-Lm8-n1]|uniref:Uncharacterized protein n=1 Tax=Suillus luteus UH-Slu-Lm8-n1 TaxID=930992 RepID=A0A0C9Z9A2_9AGAM|nr:hypothetical protein CY34DRAFT_661830 [Suillus luteus UH-Slu-Lm8-n1]KIK34457.1 hypothetical protein CY34DRAFT_642890 [Suillus luteus UH-Slu-Lm8-n1]
MYCEYRKLDVTLQIPRVLVVPYYQILSAQSQIHLRVPWVWVPTAIKGRKSTTVMLSVPLTWHVPFPSNNEDGTLS